MAILVVEDDAQNGVDHVDGHRTVALAISPYARRGIVDSTFYSQPSMVKTIELMLGLPAMSIFDLVAHGHARELHRIRRARRTSRRTRRSSPGSRCSTMNLRVGAINGPDRRRAARARARASARMNFDEPDEAPSRGAQSHSLARRARAGQRRIPR